MYPCVVANIWNPKKIKPVNVTLKKQTPQMAEVLNWLVTNGKMEEGRGKRGEKDQEVQHYV